MLEGEQLQGDHNDTPFYLFPFTLSDWKIDMITMRRGCDVRTERIVIMWCYIELYWKRVTEDTTHVELYRSWTNNRRIVDPRIRIQNDNRGFCLLQFYTDNVDVLRLRHIIIIIILPKDLFLTVNNENRDSVHEKKREIRNKRKIISSKHLCGVSFCHFVQFWLCLTSNTMDHGSRQFTTGQSYSCSTCTQIHVR